MDIDFYRVLYGFLIHIVLYYGIGLLFLLFDYRQRKTFTAKWLAYKNNLYNECSSGELLCRIILSLCLNEITTFLFTCLMYPIFVWNVGEENMMTHIYPKYGLVQTIIGIILCEDILFYTIHRLLHTRYLYRFHRKHHEFIRPFALTAIYSSPVEHVFSNLLPIFCSSLIMSLNWWHLQIFMIIATINTLFAHSGYKISQFHYKHHIYFSFNYGVLGMMDKIFGTYK